MRIIVSGLLALAMFGAVAAKANASGDLRDSRGYPICTHGDC
jgi:hypothetical protein